MVELVSRSQDVEPYRREDFKVETIERSVELKQKQPLSEDIHEGGRNAELARVAGKMRYSGFDATDIEESLQTYNENHCVPPLSEEEVRNIARSVGNYPTNTPITLRINGKEISTDPVQVVDAAAATQGTPTYTWESATAISDIPDTPKEWIIPGILTKGESTMMSGDFGSFKSYMTLFIADAVSEGGMFVNRIAQKHPVLILDRENSKATLSLRRYIVGNLRSSKNVKMFSRFTQPCAPEITNPELLKICGEVHPLVIIDSAMDFHPGKKENDADDMAVFGMEINGLIDAGAVAVLIIHHVPKTGKGKGKMYRGSTAIPGSFGGALLVEKVGRVGVKISGFKTRDDGDAEVELKLRFPNEAEMKAKTEKVTYEIVKGGLNREDELRAQVVRYVMEHDGCSTNAAAKAVGGDRNEVYSLVDELIGSGALRKGESKPFGLHATGKDSGQAAGGSRAVTIVGKEETVEF